MKKTLTILLTLALVAIFAFALVACDDKGNEGGNNNDGGNTPPATLTSEKGNTYKQSRFVVTWESEEGKNKLLDEMELTEEQFMQLYNGLQMSMTFGDDRVSVNVPGYGPTGYAKMNLYYSIAENGVISFYETAEEKENGTPFTGEGIFESTFTISSDYTTVSMSAPMPGTRECAIVLSVVQ